MKTLVLITSQFPFGQGESFIVSEFPQLAVNFDKIIIIAQNISSEKQRVTSENTKVYRYNTATSFNGFLKMINLLTGNANIISRLYREEVSFREEKNSKLSIKNISFLLKKIIKTLQLRNFIRSVIKKEGIDESLVFYSYWLKTGAHAISLLDYKKSIRISRAHGSDIYEERTEKGYLPLLRFSALNLDAIFFASKNGKEYFEEKTGTKSPRFIVSRLGVTKPIEDAYTIKKSDKFNIVSCSNMIALKRIDIIIRALSIVKTDIEIEWMHFGDGILKESLSRLASDILHTGKINFRFMGHYSNEDLLKFYAANKIDLFINTSSTEGIPVSIMEAQAYGIPVIATDTGGVNEIISKNSGSLLPVSLAPEDLAREIEHYLLLSVDDSEKLKANSIDNWKANFNALSNYRNFITEVNSILASGK
jgi:colanic acid/amylovoran biosynthesis glycosyltransferase